MVPINIKSSLIRIQLAKQATGYYLTLFIDPYIRHQIPGS